MICEVGTFGWRLYLTAVLKLHSSRPEPPTDLSTLGGRSAAPGLVAFLDVAARCRFGGAA